MWESIWSNTLGGVATTAVVSGVVYFVRFLKKVRRGARQISSNVAGLRSDLRRSRRQARERFEELEDRVDAHDEQLDEQDQRITRFEQQTIKEDHHGEDPQAAAC